jgi:tetraacyldisaccharide 4'-kinase
MHFEELWTAATFKAKLLRTVLTPASWLYAAGWQGYAALYRVGIKTALRPHSPVICIGNLQVGGTGKTPTTLHVADVLIELGRSVVVSCSGYGSPASEAAKLAPVGPLKATLWGDEAALIRMMRPHIPLIVGRRRVLAAEICHREFPEATLVMDDGFQHLPLHKDISILLDPPTSNKRCLPAGPYREPRSGRRYASLLISHFVEGGELGQRTDRFWIKAKPLLFRTPEEDLRVLTGDVNVVCALARPQRFLDGLHRLGLNVRRQKLLPDHDSLSAGNLLNDLRGPIVVTRKDWVKLRERSDVESFEVTIADREITIEPQSDFRTWLQAHLNGVETKRV